MRALTGVILVLVLEFGTFDFAKSAVRKVVLPMGGRFSLAANIVLVENGNTEHDFSFNRIIVVNHLASNPIKICSERLIGSTKSSGAVTKLNIYGQYWFDEFYGWPKYPVRMLEFQVKLSLSDNSLTVPGVVDLKSNDWRFFVVSMINKNDSTHGNDGSMGRNKFFAGQLKPFRSQPCLVGASARSPSSFQPQINRRDSQNSRKQHTTQRRECFNGVVMEPSPPAECDRSVEDYREDGEIIIYGTTVNFLICCLIIVRLIRDIRR